ncbi:uncharacterized protein EV420DRAFT_1543719 [Desarmillaria tabescens]|uniref:Uncharacterized protein n=1 Tax=Armillaria tabescens TaxID=1929756 RepID=A0AA39KE58_ARMTA|nr:uncharacterized protein EV420DRAFT_1543719 [Desarmillaria tabescens]KAK0458139.1 hypothetical protein EV420DRAFT_1543719 [Desarmillaria tabescens]
MPKVSGDTLCNSKPRRRPAHFMWADREGNSVIEQEIKALKEKGLLSEKDELGKRQALRTERFNLLSQEDRNKWQKMSKNEHDIAMRKWNGVETSKEPLENTKVSPFCSLFAFRSIERFPSIVRPILDVIAKATEGELVLLWGGREPGDDGRLNVLGMSTGNIINSDKDGYVGAVVPFVRSYLEKRFNLEDCRAMALPAQYEGLRGLGFGEVEHNGAFLHRLDDANTTSRASAAPLSSSGEPSVKAPGAICSQGTEPAESVTLSMVLAGKASKKVAKKSQPHKPGTSSTASAPSTTPPVFRRISNGSSPSPRASIVASSPPLSPRLSAAPSPLGPSSLSQSPTPPPLPPFPIASGTLSNLDATSSTFVGIGDPLSRAGRTTSSTFHSSVTPTAVHRKRQRSTSSAAEDADDGPRQRRFSDFRRDGRQKCRSLVSTEPASNRQQDLYILERSHLRGSPD